MENYNRENALNILHRCVQSGGTSSTKERVTMKKSESVKLKESEENAYSQDQ